MTWENFEPEGSSPRRNLRTSIDIRSFLNLLIFFPSHAWLWDFWHDTVLERQPTIGDTPIAQQECPLLLSSNGTRERRRSFLEHAVGRRPFRNVASASWLRHSSSSERGALDFDR